MKTKDNLKFLVSVFLVQARCSARGLKSLNLKKPYMGPHDKEYVAVNADPNEQTLTFQPADSTSPALTITGLESHLDKFWSSLFDSLYQGTITDAEKEDPTDEFMAIIDMAFYQGKAVGEALSIANAAETKQKGVDAPAAVNNDNFRSANQWFVNLSLDQLQAVTGLCRDAYDPGDNDASFLDACDRWWLSKSAIERCYIWRKSTKICSPLSKTP